MNKTFKVVFNRARGVLMVANEITSSVQKKGTKTVVAVAVASAMTCGVAVAQDFTYKPTTDGNSGYLVTTAEESAKTFAKDDVLLMDITGANTRAYGLLASGKDHKYTNEGVIKVNINATENKTPYWQVKGMMAERGGTAVNAGTIEVTDAYGMTVGSLQAGETNTIINDGTINVNGGAAMEAAPTGTSSSEKTAKAVATNNGTINVTSGIGVVVSGDNGVITNNGTIDASAGDYAVFVHREKGHTASGNTITFGKDSITKGDIRVQGLSKTESTDNTTLKFEQGAKFDGTIDVATGKAGYLTTNTKLEGYLNIANQTGKVNGGTVFFGDATGSMTLTDSEFTNNSVKSNSAEAGAAGGAIYNYGTISMKGGAFIGNQAISNGLDYVKNKDYVWDGASGGAIMLKGSNPALFENVLFQNNSVIATKTEETSGGYAYGGAIHADFSTGNATGEVSESNVEFHITKDMTYFGNTVNSNSTSQKFETYNYHVNHSQAGGFLFLDRGSRAEFNIDADAVLTIGREMTSDDTDSIASSIPNKGTTTNGGKHANITKTGTGLLVINSSLNKYYGTVEAEAGRMEVNSQWNVKNAVNIATGATLALSSFNLMDADKTNNADKDGNKLGGKLTVSGTLETSSGQIFTKALDGDATVVDVEGLKYSDKLTFKDGKLALTDSKYNLAYANSAASKLSGGTVVMLGELIDTDNRATLDELAPVDSNVILDKVTVDAVNKNVQIGGTAPVGDSYREESLGVSGIDLGTADTVTVTADKTLTLTGNAGSFVSSEATSVTVNATDGGTLALGGEGSQGGELNATVNVDETSKVVVTGAENIAIANVTGNGTVLVGNNETAGNLTINSLKDMTGLIVFDPDWTEGTNTVHAATKGELYRLNIDALTTKISVARNSIVATDATSDEAISAFEAIALAQGLSWKDDVTAALYAGSQIKLDATGGILVDGSQTNATITANPSLVIGGAVTVARNGMFIVNQSNAAEAVVDGNVTLNDGSYLGVVNASEGQFTLATGDVMDGGASVVTDNPFIDGAIDGNTVTTTLNEEAGLGSLASTGIQAMTRHADFIMAETIADRTSIDQELNPGMNLWANVTGERYESTSMDNGGTFKSDMGYGAFGAEVPVTDTVTAGAAIQYGKGSLRSGVASIKNDIDNYGFTAYATKSFGAAKVVGELAYLQSKNDITSSQAAMNQEVDAKIYSAGIRAQYQLTTDHFQFVPSIGIRVSQLETDAMDVGAVKVKEQEQTLVQVPIALRINGFEQSAADGWTLAPSFKVAFVPTFGDEEISVLSHDQDVIDTTPVSADFGLRAKKGNMMVDANFMVGGGKDGTSSVGGKIGMKYVF